MRNFLSLTDCTQAEIIKMLDRADFFEMCQKKSKMPQILKNKKIGLWFAGNGFRNRVAFELGARSMGADTVYIPGTLGVDEPIEDIGHYLKNWFDMLIVRCKNSDDLKKISAEFEKPIINARTTENHPCEVMGDLEYIRKIRGSLDGLNVAFVGEYTNLCASWFEAAKVLHISVVQISPPGYEADQAVVADFNANAAGSIRISNSMESIDAHTDVLYTDCWPDKQDKQNAQIIKENFLPYQITAAIVQRINPKGFFMPCPPVTRGKEIDESSLCTKQYCDYDAKNYLLYAQNAVMEFCIR